MWQATPDLVDLHEQRVAVAVERDLLDQLGVAGGVALAPVLLPAAAPEVTRPVVSVRCSASSSIQPTMSTSRGVVLLDDGADQAVTVALQARGDAGSREAG